MLKKIISKRGFTLVEILVAFVIFAIMAAMVCSILNQALIAKQQNVALEEEIENQQTVYYGKTQDKTYDGSAGDTLSFNFNGADKVDIGYSVGDPNAPDAGNSIALEYFVGDVDYSAMTGGGNNSDPNNDKSSGSVQNRFASTNIYGSNGITQISLVLQRDTSDMSVNRYLIAAKVTGEEDQQYDMFKQFRLIFPTKMVSYGYCNYEAAGRTFRDIGTASHSGYLATATNSKTIRLSATQASTSSPLTSMTGYISFFVTLESPLEDVSATLNPYDIFGLYTTGQTDKSAQSDGSYKFTRYLEVTKDKNGKIIGDTQDKDGKIIGTTHKNVFAAVEKSKDDKGGT